MPKLRNGNNGDSNPGSLDCESGILPTELPRSTRDSQVSDEANQTRALLRLERTNNEELYLYNNDVTYYVITCNSAFEYNNDVTYYVITRNYQWTPEILTNNLLEAGCTNKLCPFQYKL